MKFVTHELEQIQALPPPTPQPVTSMGIQEMTILKKLVDRYGDNNFETMARDRKLNPWQWNSSRLQKRWNLLLQIDH